MTNKQNKRKNKAGNGTYLPAHSKDLKQKKKMTKGKNLSTDTFQMKWEIKNVFPFNNLQYK